mmetsp:Transcript_19059/g.38866  ORF Transcript_19059/g.38866 Transcript_19059/m.38866 type:complete len:415 (-) Transcript_19059:1553-2797(-)
MDLGEKENEWSEKEKNFKVCEKFINLNFSKFNPQNRTRIDIFRFEKIQKNLIIEESFFERIFQLKNNFQMQLIEQIRGSPVNVGTLEEKLGDNRAIITNNIGAEFYVEVCSFVDISGLLPGDSVLLNGKSFSVVGSIKDQMDPIVNLMKIDVSPSETFEDIGGLQNQIQEIKETIELPLNQPELFSDIGIIPPKGIILYGEPGTGKTLLAKAVANKTKATFLRVTGSELVQKFLGEGPKLVREIFRVASLLAPTVIFIDEIDAIGTIRYDSSSGGEREIQRTMLELLNQLDGFDLRENVKVIMATNRIDSLDPALIRPGRIDRKIEFPFPDEKTISKIFSVHTKKMNISKTVDLKKFFSVKDNLSGADIRAICTEAALMALRHHRLIVEQDDLIKARNIILNRKREMFSEIIYS